jgi:hypothetical protein
MTKPVEHKPKPSQAVYGKDSANTKPVPIQNVKPTPPPAPPPKKK